MAQQVSTRSGSTLSGEGPGTARHDLNRQMTQTQDPQGMYVVGADGTPYGFTNDHGPEDIDRFMDTALARFRTKPPRTVAIDPALFDDRFSIRPPAGAQVLQVYARIPAPPSTCSVLNRGVGRDFCWIYPNEAKAIASAAKGPVGARFALPRTLARRIARFHLVDDVRGTPDLWESDEVRRLSLGARIAGRDSGGVRLAFTGAFDLRSRSGRRGYGGAIDGEAMVAPSTGALTRVRLLADGDAFGVGTYTPNAPPGRFRLLVGLCDTHRPEARIVPPEEVATFNRDTRYRNP